MHMCGSNCTTALLVVLSYRSLIPLIAVYMLNIILELFSFTGIFNTTIGLSNILFRILDLAI